jgi:hypothetical protein
MLVQQQNVCTHETVHAAALSAPSATLAHVQPHCFDCCHFWMSCCQHQLSVLLLDVPSLQQSLPAQGPGAVDISCEPCAPADTPLQEAHPATLP